MNDDIAKKTLAKIDREQTKLDTMVEKRDEFTASYQAKLADFNGDITKQKKVIAELREQEKQEKLGAVAALAEKNGVSIDDLLSAALNGDFYGIQEKIEGKASTPTAKAAENTGEQIKDEVTTENTGEQENTYEQENSSIF